MPEYYACEPVPKCPYCGFEDTEYWDCQHNFEKEPNTDWDCDKCGKTYRVRAEFDVTFECLAKEEEADNGDGTEASD